MGSAKFDGVESAEEGAVVLLIICTASQGKHFLSTLKTVCSARTVRQSSAVGV